MLSSWAGVCFCTFEFTQLSLDLLLDRVIGILALNWRIDATDVIGHQLLTNILNGYLLDLHLRRTNSSPIRLIWISTAERRS